MPEDDQGFSEDGAVVNQELLAHNHDHGQVFGV